MCCWSAGCLQVFSPPHSSWLFIFWLSSFGRNKHEGYKRCQKGRLSDKRCKHLRPDGLCQPCFIKLRRYDGYGQYSSLDIIGNLIHFNVSVINRFGEVSTQHTFYLPNWGRFMNGWACHDALPANWKAFSDLTTISILLTGHWKAQVQNFF